MSLDIGRNPYEFYQERVNHCQDMVDSYEAWLGQEGEVSSEAGTDRWIQEMTREVEEVGTIVEELDREQHQAILIAANQALTQMQPLMTTLRSRLKQAEENSDIEEEKLLLNKQIVFLNDRYDPIYQRVLSMLSNKLPVILDPSSSGSYLSSMTGMMPSFTGLTQWMWTLFSRGEAASFKDDSERKVDILNSLQGKNIDANLTTITFSSGERVHDDQGNEILVPMQFGKDILRAAVFSLNGDEIVKEKQSEEIAHLCRALKEQLGERGAIRVMLLCTQTTLAHLLTFMVLPLTIGDGVFARAFPGKDLHFAQTAEGGVSCDVSLNSQNQVIINLKIPMKLFTVEVEEEIKGFFVLKSTISIPLESLQNEEISEADFHIEDKISHLFPTESQAMKS